MNVPMVRTLCLNLNIKDQSKIHGTVHLSFIYCLYYYYFIYTNDTTVAAKYNVSAMPTFIFIKSGEIIDRLMGANVDRLQEMIDEHK
jgi:Thioredoxin